MSCWVDRAGLVVLKRCSERREQEHTGGRSIAGAERVPRALENCGMQVPAELPRISVRLAGEPWEGQGSQ